MEKRIWQEFYLKGVLWLSLKERNLNTTYLLKTLHGNQRRNASLVMALVDMIITEALNAGAVMGLDMN